MDRFQEALAKLDPAIPVYVAAQEVMQEVVGYPFHRGCLAAGERVDLDAKEAILSSEGPKSVIVLEGLVDHDNIGGIFRNAAAFGVDGVLLDPTCADPLYRKATRVSIGNTLLLPFARLTEWPSAIEELKERGYACFALTPRSSAWPLEGVLTQPLPERVAFFLGTEGAGLSEVVLDACTALFRIPMSSGVDSLNVATTSGIALYLLQLARQGV